MSLGVCGEFGLG